jgi:hypothetical protein
MRILIALMLCGAAYADSSVGKTTAPAETGWCLNKYLKATKRAVPKPIATTVKPMSFKLGAIAVQLDMPEKLAVAVSAAPDLIHVGDGKSDNFTDWPATLQIRPQTRAELDARIKAIQSDFMGSTRVEIEARPSKLGEEVCAVVRRVPGHATLIDGRHVPMPDSLELVRGFVHTVGDKTLTAAYRLPPRDVDQVQWWDKILESLRLTR